MKFVAGPAACALIIPTRDRARRLLDTLSRIAATPGPEVEVVVVDNGSIDGTSQRLAAAYPAVQLIQAAQNLGTAARNQGARRAKSAVIFMLDDDSGPAAGTIETCLAALADPSLGIAAVHVRLPHGKWEEGGDRHVHIGCGAAMRRNVFLELGGYPSEYETYVEEYDLAYRVLAADLQVSYLDGAEVWHEPAARTSFDYMVEKLTANNVYLAARFYPWETALRTTAWMLYRYSRFAHQRGADNGFRRATEALPDKLLRGQRHAQLLPDRVLELILPERAAVPTFLSLRGRGKRGVCFLRAGKQIPGLLAAARQAGMRINGIYESPDGLFRDAGHLFDVPIRPLSDLNPGDDEAVVIGGTSPGFVINTRELAEEINLGEVIEP